MKNKLILILLSIILGTTVSYSQSEQEIKSLMTERVLTCADIDYNLEFLLPYYLENQRFDTINSIIQFWEKECGETEISQRIKILIAIAQNDLHDSVYETNIIFQMSTYKQFAIKNKPEDTTKAWFTPDMGLDFFCEDLARQLVVQDNYSTQELYFLYFYSNQFYKAEKLASNEEFMKSNISKLKVKQQAYLDTQAKGNFSIYSGVWVPGQNLATLGVKPMIGFKAGADFNRINWDFNMHIRFLNSPNYYEVYHQDSLKETNYHVGLLIGLDGGLTVLQTKRHRLDFKLGMAYDLISTLKTDPEYDTAEDQKTLGTFNLNYGIEYRYKFSSGSYIGFDGRYYMVNYNNENGTNLDGNASVFTLLYGFCM